MSTKIFVLKMDGCDDQVVLAQSKKELAFRLYGMKIEKPAQQLFLDPKASITYLASVEKGMLDFDDDVDKVWSVCDLVNYASGLMADRDVEVLPL